MIPIKDKKDWFSLYNGIAIFSRFFNTNAILIKKSCTI